MAARYYGGVDLGGTKVTTLIADEQGTVIARIQEPFSGQGGRYTRWRDGVAFSGASVQIESMLRRLLAESNTPSLTGIGIGSAGPLQDGAVKNPTNIPLPAPPAGLPARPLYLPLTEPLAAAFDTPARLENDCNAAAVGEAYYGVGRGTRQKSRLHLVYVTISTGLGAGVWTGGGLLMGKEGNAAEMGHVLVKEGGLRCGCGNNGCAEAYCSGSGIVKNARVRLADADLSADLPLLRLARAAVGTGSSTPQLPDRFALLDFITAPLVFEAAQEGDRIARAVIEDAVHYGGIALAAIANAFDPQTITLGGAIATAHPELVMPMREEMSRHLNVTPPTVQLTPLGNSAVEHGAIALAQQAQKDAR